MKGKTSVGLIAIIAIIVAVIFSGCTEEAPMPTPTTNLSPTPTPWGIPPNKYVFIDHHIHTYGELIEGSYPSLMVDFPTYNFNKETGSLSGMINFDINETLKAVYGDGLSLSGAAGGGAATGLSGVYELPYEKGGITILKIDSDGTAYIVYKGVSIILKNDEEWVNITSRVDIQETGKAKLTETDKIVNYGILDKSKIEKW